MRLHILGPLRVIQHGTEVDSGPNQQRCLLALLLAREGHPISMNELLELLWGSDSPPTAVNVIHKYVGQLRRLLEPGLPPRATGAFLARHGNGYRFTAGPHTLDLVRFRELVAEASAGAARNEPDEALERYAEALRLGAGRAGDGLADTPAARAVFASLDSEFNDAVLAAADIAVRRGRPALLLAPLRRAAELHPLNELIQASLMTTLAAAGHQAEALSTYRTVRGLLAEELGVDPGHALLEAHRRVLAPQAPGPAQLPPGLPPFAGRANELATLDRLAGALRDDTPGGPLVIALDGPEGAGKSALAVHFARLVAGEFPDGQLYLDLENTPGGDNVRCLLHGLGMRTPELPGPHSAQVGAYRSLTAGRRLLILLDNACDAAQVQPLLPSSAGSLVLVTSRQPLLELVARSGAHQLRVGPPTLPAARELLELRLTDRPYDAADTRALEEIAELCGRMPSALSLLAARLSSSPRLSLAALTEELRATAPGGGLDEAGS